MPDGYLKVGTYFRNIFKNHVVSQKVSKTIIIRESLKLISEVKTKFKVTFRTTGQNKLFCLVGKVLFF